MNGYELSRIWFDWCFVNPELIKPNHSALYFFCIEHCNRLGWKEKFGLPTTMVMEAIGIKSYNTYKETLTDLVNWGFIKMIEKSKNQYSANIIALSNFNKANNKAVDEALDKALIKHASKQSESTSESIDSIDKQLTINNKQYIDDVKEEKTTPTHNFFTIKNFEDEIIIGINEFSRYAISQTKRTEAELKKYISEFLISQKALSNFSWANEADAKKHFISWVKKQPNPQSISASRRVDN